MPGMLAACYPPVLPPEIALTVPDLITEIRAELDWLGATHPDVPVRDAISMSDRENGNAVLQGSPRGINFDWFGAQSEILERLRGLPDKAGPEGIRSEFA